jgi:soluble lytic murein transglycosylase-like protein
MAANNIYIQVDFNSQNAQQNVNALNQSIANTGPTAQKSSQQATQGFQSIGVSVSQVNREFSQLTSALAGLGLAKAIGGMVQLAAEMSRAERAQTAFAGSAEKANEIFEQVRAIAAQSPFKFDDLEETAQRLLVLGVAGKNVTDVLKVVTDQVARMGGTVHDVNTIVNLFGRMIQKDFVGAMDLLRALPAQGVPVIKALGDALEKELGRPFNTTQVKEAIKSGILDPMQTIRVMLEAMRQKGDAAAFSDDAARAFKNLGDTIRETTAKLFGPDGFGPALRKLADHIGELLAPLGGFVHYLMQLSEPTKELIVNVTAAAAAFAVFGTALGIVTSLAGPLLGLVGSMWKFTAALVAMNPELAISVALLGALSFAAYKLIPQFKGLVDSVVGGAIDKIKSSLHGLAEEGKKFFAEILKPGTPIETGGLTRTEEAFRKLLDEEQKHADAAQKTLLEALASPAEAVQMKYATLFRELNKKIEDELLNPVQAATLRGILSTAEAAEAAGAQFKENKRQLDEYTRYQVERAKGAADAQVAYIEAQDAQDLRSKVRAIDRVAQIRMDAAQQVGEIEKHNLEEQFNSFVNMANQYRTQFAEAGVDVDAMILQHREELTRRQGMIEQKQFDEAQKYRLEGWKKANDAIIEDQKRVYDAFKDQFSQLFDMFMDKTKSLGQALGDFVKKLAVGEAKELFTNALAGAATQAAGYGRPEESISRGGQGIVGILLRRGVPPRPPLPPPEVQEQPAAVSSFQPLTSSIQGSTHRFEISTDAYAVATIRFADAVNNFAARASGDHIGSAARMADADTTVSEAFQTASGATGVPQSLLRAVAQAESSMNPRAVSPKGAMGLMQLMPGTAADLGVTRPFDIGQNVMGGAQQLQAMLTRYNGNVPLALAAYNMGAHALDKRLAEHRALPRETRDYVARITRLMDEDRGGVGGADISEGDARYLRATGGAAPVTLAQLANLPTRGMPLLLPGLPGSVTTGPSVAELASLPQGPSALQRLGPLLGPVLGGMGMGTGTAGGGGGGVGLAGLGLPNLASLRSFFGLSRTAVYGQTPGAESLARAAASLSFGSKVGGVLTSPAVGMLATLGGAVLATKGLHQQYAPATVAGGGLAGAGYVLTNPALLAKLGPAGIGAGAAAGAGLGLFASGFQRGGGAGLAMDIGGGALAGAGIGFMVGGPLGAAIGAGIGAAAGAITGVVRLFVHTEQERIRTGIKQVYGIDISNRQILSQIQQIVDQKYGGSVAIGIRSQDVQDIIRLYALSTGQAAKLPRPMYAATIAQSQAGGLATQPVYQGGVLVQNPYTGPTTYQYQTAVTAAQGLVSGNAPGAGSQVSNIFMQLNPQQANDLFTGRVVQAVQQNPAAVASANASATRAGDSRVSQASNMLEPLTSLS